MGSFNGTCILTNLPIGEGDKVYAVPILRTRKTWARAYPNEPYLAYGGFLEGEYNDYGGIENVKPNPFSELVNNFFGFDVCSESFEAPDPYGVGWGTSSESGTVVSKLKSTLTNLPSINNLNDVEREIMEFYGFTGVDNDPYVYAFNEQVTVKFSTSSGNSYTTVSCEVSGSNSDSNLVSVSSYAQVFNAVDKVIMEANDSGLLLSNRYQFALPGLSYETAQKIVLLRNTELVFIHKEAFDAYCEELAKINDWDIPSIKDYDKLLAGAKQYVADKDSLKRAEAEATEQSDVLQESRMNLISDGLALLNLGCVRNLAYPSFDMNGFMSLCADNGVTEFLKLDYVRFALRTEGVGWNLRGTLSRLGH